MEPCAPGTEDEPPISYSTLNKQANEKERLLNLKAVLKNGKYDNIFELSYVNGAEHWFCNACQCPIMGRVYQHEIGKRHSLNLSGTGKRDEPESKEESPDDQPISLEIAPGEPVPPGFEEEIGRMSQIQERLDGFKVGPLVALEYLLELQDFDVSKEPVYLCILCDKKGDPRTVLTHLASYNHISQYLQKHFPTCYRALAPYMTKQYKRNWQTTLQKIAEAIEKKFGRLKPYPIEKDKFDKDRQYYSQLISKGKHFSEISGWTFEELIVHDELTKAHHDEEKTYESTPSSNWGAQTYIQKPFKKRSPSPPVVQMPGKRVRGNAQTNPKKQLPAYVPATKQEASRSDARRGNSQSRRRSLSSVSSISSSDMSDNESRRRRSPVRQPRIRTPPHQRGRPSFYERRRSPSPIRRSSPPRRGKQPPRHNEPPPRRAREEASEVKKMTEVEREKMRKIEEFRKLARAIENDMHKTLKQHEKNPEKHPQYNDEWKKFWNRRYKELQAQGVDVAKHDFKPEWITFWNKRMVELHSDELRAKKDALRKRLGLPEEPAPVRFKIGITPGKASPKENKPNLPMAAQPDQDNEVIIIDDKDDDVKSSGAARRSRSHSPWERESPPARRPASRRSRSNSRPRRRSPVVRRSRSRERSPREVRRRSPSKERAPPKRSESRGRSLTREFRGVSKQKQERPERQERQERVSRDKEWDRDKRPTRSRSRERSWERRDVEKKRVDYRESSYERDLRGKDRVRTVADLPWEREKVYRHHFDNYYKPPPVMRDVTRKPIMMPEIPGVPVVLPPEEDDDGEVNVVDVLRLLTALEERLGSLGPKVLDLLAQALALEKKEANSSETLLDNDINCVLFETAKEKLKGQLLAGLVDIVQERAFKKAIKKTATLIHMSSQRKRQRERLMPRTRPVTVPGVGTVDKAAIAKQIATALIMQGKTDVTQGELEQLINAVVGMAEASKNSNRPITTATFLQQLSEGSIGLEDLSKQNHIDKETGDKIIIPTQCKTEIVELEKLTEPLTPSPGKNSANNMENLSDSDLQTLLQNFKDLSTDEQHNLINYLKKLEAHEPERVERLRKFVNLDANLKVKTDDQEENSTESKRKSSGGRESPFSSRRGGVNPMVDDVTNIISDEEAMEDEEEEEKPQEKQKPQEKERPSKIDSEDEDYSFEDVAKAASKNVKDKEFEVTMKVVKDSMEFDTRAKAKPKSELSDAKSLISSLMSNFSKSGSSSVDLLGLGKSTVQPAPVSASSIIGSADFAKTLSTINMANLASIVSNVKKMSPIDTPVRPLNFQPPSPVRNAMNFDPSPLGQRPASPNRHLDFGGPQRVLRTGAGMMFDEPRRDLGPMRDVGMPPRDRGFVQYPRGQAPYGANYGNSYAPPPMQQQFGGMGPRSGFEPRRMDNSRFGGNMGAPPYNGRPGGGGYNRW